MAKQGCVVVVAVCSRKKVHSKPYKKRLRDNEGLTLKRIIACNMVCVVILAQALAWYSHHTEQIFRRQGT